MRSAISLTLLLALAPACAPLVIGGGAILVSQSAIEDATYVVQVKVGVELSWASAKTTLSHLSLKPIDTDDEARKAVAEIDNSKVTVTVEAYDLEQSMITVSAMTNYGIRDAATASMVKDKLLTDLERKK
jgi:hypothetical protein